MHGEIPVLTRCCICFPLRHGLLAWAYFRLIVTGAFFTSLTINFIEFINNDKVRYLKVMGVVMFILFTDIVLTSMFVVGGHLKNLQILKAFYIYSIFLWCLMMLLVMTLTVQTVDQLRTATYHRYVRFLILDLTSFVFQVMIQSYVILLVRSEIVKLSNNCEFRFVNNAAQVELHFKGDDEDTEQPNLQKNGNMIV
ncbi:uncharacterized protein LOC124636606 [Helicoverpa zea]|uniref:uncharacterized protein LOC124636606 n=1 Tax=Helicoverpa zea TaxID=7113 RepID=UPI001F56B144|nr:uncharacterized protein LOC124636606 [Helicoverpa zea]